jgi:Sec-independent protein secretion pathway component TatC
MKARLLSALLSPKPEPVSMGLLIILIIAAYAFAIWAATSEDRAAAERASSLRSPLSGLRSR